MFNEDTAKNRRTWTDDQLRDAIQTQRCWREVQRQLDLNPISSSVRRTLQRRAAQLGLDTGHFIGARRWTDKQLIDASAKAASWRELTEFLGVRDYSNMRSHIKGHAARLSIDLGHLATPGPKPIIKSEGMTTLTYTPGHLRRAAPAIATAWFALRGCTSSLPMEPEVYDLLVGSPEGLQRVQVKSTTCKSANDDAWMVKVGHGSGGKRNTVGVIPYDHEAIDLYFIVDGDLRLYLIPSVVLGGRIRVSLRAYEAYCVGDATSLLSLSPN